MMRRRTMESSLLIIGKWLNLKITPDTRENGSLIKISVREREHKFGQMDRCMKAGGWIIRLMAKEGLFMLMEMCMMDNG